MKEYLKKQKQKKRPIKFTHNKDEEHIRSSPSFFRLQNSKTAFNLNQNSFFMKIVNKFMLTIIIKTQISSL